MINVISMTKNQRQELLAYGQELFLESSAEIESEFYHIVEWEEEAFKDELSLKLMKEIDHAERTGDYEVVTPFGKSCITCLSTGGKLGLIFLYYRGIDRKIITDFSRAGTNVWEFLSKNTDITFYMLRKANTYWPDDGENLELVIDGRRYSGKNFLDLLHLDKEWFDELCKMTKEKEEKAYENYISQKSGRNKKLYRKLREEVAFSDFIDEVDCDFFNCYEKEGEDYALVCEYRVVNYMAYLPDDLFYRKLPLYCIGKCGEKREFTKSLTGKYPSFLEALVYGAFLGETWIERGEKQESICFQSRYDEYFVLVLRCDENCDIFEYPQLAAFGVLVSKKDKTVTIYDGRQGVEEFHRRYQSLEN